MNIVILGLSITSSWGNGHATTYRGLIRELVRLGHSVLFLERDMPWYAGHRDIEAHWSGCTGLYTNLDELKIRFTPAVRNADMVIVGSYVPEGAVVSEWVLENASGLTAFYDIDTPVTLARLEQGDEEYLSRSQVPRFRMYLSFTGGPTLARIERQFGSPMARVLYCSVDPELYRPQAVAQRWDLGYIGTYSEDRQPFLDCLMLEAARRWPEARCVVAGPQYPEEIDWPANVERIDHLAPGDHRRFYNSQRLTMNITRADMKAAGYSPSVRLFEAAACGTPIVTDFWQGLDAIFEIGREILIANCAEDVLRYLREWPQADLAAVGQRGRARILAAHTAAHRALELEKYAREAGV